MDIIKLNAIHSTNDYLKSLLAERHVENFTIVVAESQTAGRGQMGAKWISEPGKNLTFSVLIRDLLLGINEIFDLNVAVAVSIAEAIGSVGMRDISIKWPNDILAGSYKLGGILIENSIRNDGEIYSVVGIGLNINQTNFEGLPKATSLAVAAGKQFDKDDLMLKIAEKLRRNISRLTNKDTAGIWQSYHQKLFKRGQPMPFEKEGQRFMGIILGVLHNGNLQVQLEDDSVAEFGLKEVMLLY